MSEQQHDASGDGPEVVQHRPTRGDPPREHRFAPGTSGNPRGRPKGSRNFATLVRQELDRKISATADGRTVTMSRREAMAKRLVGAALKGDLKAIEATLRYSGELESRLETLPMMDADPERDRQILEAYMRRLGEESGHAGSA